MKMLLLSLVMLVGGSGFASEGRDISYFEFRNARIAAHKGLEAVSELANDVLTEPVTEEKQENHAKHTCT